MMKKVLVIGGAGFIGSNLCHNLVETGKYEVFSFDRNKPIITSNLVHYMLGDFFEDETLKKIIVGMDYIVHAISTVNPGNSNEKFMQGYEKDLVQTVKLCSYLVGKDTKLIFLSSGGTVYGNYDIQPISEEFVPKPINHYGNIKLSIENTLRTFNYQMNNKMLIVRISNPYGYGQDYNKGVGFIDAVLKRTLAKQPIEIWGDGENIRDYIYIDDVCKMITALFDYCGEYDTFNISTGIGTSQNDIINYVKNLGYSPIVKYFDSRSVDVKKIVLSNSRIREVYCENLVCIEDGMRKYLKELETIIE